MAPTAAAALVLLCMLCGGARPCTAGRDGDGWRPLIIAHRCRNSLPLPQSLHDPHPRCVQGPAHGQAITASSFAPHVLARLCRQAVSLITRSVSKTWLYCSVVFARGSPCELPEETLEGYAAALDVGVDFIELDAVHSLCWVKGLQSNEFVCLYRSWLSDMLRAIIYVIEEVLIQRCRTANHCRPCEARGFQQQSDKNGAAVCMQPPALALFHGASPGRGSVVAFGGPPMPHGPFHVLRAGVDKGRAPDLPSRPHAWGQH